MASLFPDQTYGSDGCMVRDARDTACLEPWRSMERKVAIILLVVPVAVFAWKVALFLAMGGEEVGAGWLPSVVRLPRDEEVRVGPAITYRDVEEEGGEEDSLRAEVGRLIQDSNLATHVMGSSGRARPSPLISQQEGEGNMWARD